MLETEPKIREEFVYTGRAKLVFSHILDYANSPKASQAAECAGDQGKFWEMHDLLFEKQGPLFGRDVDNHLLSLARDLKLDETAFSQCYTSGKYARLVRQADETAKASGIRTRPTFVIGQRRVQGALPWPQFQALLQEAAR